jgi:hypothetical protein
MKAFISWSGRQSRMVAAALNDWLPKVIQAVEPFYSPDMEKGAQWSTQMDAALEGTSFGVVCLTRENLPNGWIHFEAGALSKIAGSRVWTFLVGLRPGDVEQPLGKFQATIAEKSDVRKLVDAINQQLPTPLAAAVLDDAFETRWPALKAKLDEAMAYQATSSRKPVRDTNAMLEELLTLVRGQERRAEVMALRDDFDESSVRTERIYLTVKTLEDANALIERLNNVPHTAIEWRESQGRFDIDVVAISGSLIRAVVRSFSKETNTPVIISAQRIAGSEWLLS